MASHTRTPTEMQVLLYQQTATQIQQLWMSYVSGRIDGHAFTCGRASILDDYLSATDSHGNMALTISRLEKGQNTLQMKTWFLQTP
jgi:hypothetical protein